MTQASNKPDTGAEGVLAMLEDEDDGQLPGRQIVNYPGRGEKFRNMTPGFWRDQADEWGLPPECPVLPLGYEGESYFFLDTGGQVQILHRRDFNKNALGQLFMGHHLYLGWACPKFTKEGEISKGYDAEEWYDILRNACFRKGPWNMVEKVRGRGAWKLENGELLLHTGTRLETTQERFNLGELEGFVYTTRPPIPRPWVRTLDGLDGPALELLPLLQTWNWDKPELAPILYLGWNAQAKVAGALPWRASIGASGDAGIGKSTLIKIAKGLHDNGIVHSTNATAAGIYQNMRHDALPVILDEFEASPDPRQNKAMLDFLRQAADNNLLLRGGDNHKGVQFYCRSPFMIAGINLPAMDRATRSRLALLRLYPVDTGNPEPVLDEKQLELWGRQMQRRILDNWWRFAETYSDYRAVLAEGGLPSRGQDTYGILLTMADLAIDRDARALELPMGPDGDRAAWAEICSASALGIADEVENWRECLDHLISVHVDAWKTGSSRVSIGQVLEDLLRKPSDDRKLEFPAARDLLGRAGVGLQAPKRGDPHVKVLIPNSAPGVRRLFFDTKWFGEAGMGIWDEAIRQAPREMWALGSARVGGKMTRGTVFSVRDVLGLKDGEEIEGRQQELPGDGF